MRVDDGFEVVDGRLVSYTGSQERIKLPTYVHTIGARAFAGNAHMKEVKLGPGVETIENEAFAGCSALESACIVFTVLNIGVNAFAGCACWYQHSWYRESSESGTACQHRRYRS